MSNGNNTKSDEQKTNEELLNEVKELRKSIEEQNKKINQNSAQNTMIAMGAILLIIAAGIFLFSRCFL